MNDFSFAINALMKQVFFKNIQQMLFHEFL